MSLDPALWLGRDTLVSAMIGDKQTEILCDVCASQLSNPLSGSSKEKQLEVELSKM